MKNCLLLSLLLALGCVHVHGAPVEQGGVEQGSCEDASALGAAGLALTKINQDRKEGYIFSLHRLSNVHMKTHQENGVVFYLTMDVVETNCSVHSRKEWKTCEARPTSDTPVYGQCKAAIFISKVHRVVRLYKYDCVIRPVPAARVNDVCPDCPTHVSFDNAEVQKTVSASLDKFNKESTLAKRFSLLKINRATSGMAVSMYYNVEYTIQETTCTKSADAATPCPPMDCEFAHKGLCKASHFHSPDGEDEFTVECEIFEPEAAETQKKLHMQAGQGHDHVHADHTHTHDQGHNHGHDHSHDHDHDHSHQHAAGGSHTHAHDHSHDHGHSHAHAHLHDHEHHHHHDHNHEVHTHPEGSVRMLPAMDQPMTLPAFPDVPAGGPEVGVTLPLKPDPQIPGQMEPTIEAFPTAVSAQCSPSAVGTTLVETLFTEDAMFRPAA